MSMAGGGHCTSCGAPVASHQRFCASCGAPVAPVAPIAAVPPPPPYGETPAASAGGATATQPVAPIPAGSAPGETQVVPVDLEPQRQRRSMWPFVLVGVLLVAACGALAWFYFFSDQGGADSPEAAVEMFAEAVGGGDPFAVLSAIAPSEAEGVAELLQTIDTELTEQGVDASSRYGSIGATVELSGVTTVEEAEGAAIVEADVTMELEPNGFAQMAFGSLVPDDDERVEVDEFRFVVVEEDGGWYVSPLMTAAESVVTFGDYESEADLRQVSADVARPARSAADAVEDAADAAADLDAAALASATSPEISRVLLVYEDAFDELADSLTSSGFDVSTVDIDATELEGGEIGIEAATVTGSTGSGSFTVNLDEDCVEVLRPTEGGDDVVYDRCVLSRGDIELDEDFLVVQTEQVDGGYVVDPLTSIIELAVDAVDGASYQTLLDLLGLERLDAGSATSLGKGVAKTIEFDDAPYVMAKVGMDDGDIYRVSAFGEHDGFEVYESVDGGPLREVSRTGVLDDDVVLYALVRAPLECDDSACTPDGSGDVEVVAHTAFEQALSGPDRIVRGTLAAGDGYAFSFPVSDATAVTWVPNSSDILVNIRRQNESIPWSSTVLEPGSYVLEVWNTSDSELAFEVEPVIGDSAMLDSYDTYDVALDTPVASTFTVAPGSFVDVYAIGYEGQDIVLAATTSIDDSCSYRDAEVSDTEQCRVEVGGDGVLVVEITPYSSDSAYGFALVELYGS